jgi:hypothetical protein
MLLAASDEPHENVEPLAPPTGALPGERIWFGDAHEQVRGTLSSMGGCRTMANLSAGLRCPCSRAGWHTSQSLHMVCFICCPFPAVVLGYVRMQYCMAHNGLHATRGLCLGLLQAKPLEPNQVAKKKVWETAAPGFRTDARGIAGFKGVHMQTSAGPVAAPTLRSSRIG